MTTIDIIAAAGLCLFVALLGAAGAHPSPRPSTDEEQEEVHECRVYRLRTWYSEEARA